MTRARYEPPSATESAPPVASLFTARRVGNGEVMPWVIGEAAANSMPSSAGPAPEELLEIAAQARREGLAAGLADAEQELAETRAAFIAQAQTSLAALADVRAAMIETYRVELAELALAVAEAVLQREIGDGKATLAALLQQALVEMDPHERCTISVATDAAADINAWAQTRWPAAVVRADAALRAGELRVDAATGRIEVNHAKRIERVRRLVLGDGES